MATPKTRWVCSRCGGAVMGPRRPRLNDVSRYCLSCSAETGRLVNRRAPVLDRQKKEAAERRLAKRGAAVERRKKIEDDRFNVHAIDAAGRGYVVDVRDEVKLCAALPTVRRGLSHHRGGKAPDVHAYRSATGRGWRGTAWPWENRIRVRVTDGMAYEELIELVLHEVVHCALPSGEMHGMTFKRMLVDAAQERWPAVQVGTLRRGAYAIDSVIVRALMADVRAKDAYPPVAAG